MKVIQLDAKSPGKNFNYLIICEHTKQAIAIDPLNAPLILQALKKEQAILTHILNTHEHFDHTQGNAALIKATKARLLAHQDAVIDNVSVALKSDETLKIGDEVTLKIFYTPGHTLAHVCAYLVADKGCALFSGDTLFNAGAGNCYNGGDENALYHTFYNILLTLPDDTIIFPGHDYIENNLNFTLNYEPNNQDAKAWLERVQHEHTTNKPCTTTLKDEKAINLFFRLTLPEVQTSIKAASPLPREPSVKDYFLALRALRNNW